MTKIKNNKATKQTIASAVDTFHELFIFYGSSLLLASIGYSILENETFWNGVWWAVVTSLTVGYGDITPDTVGGRLIGMALMFITVFMIIPLITANVAKRLIVDNDSWTHREQEAVKTRLGLLMHHFGIKDKK